MASGRSDLVRNVLLIGFMASGKSTVGRMLADRLGWAFADFDAEVERRAGRSVPVLFAEQGEAAFRALEARVAEDLLARSRTVLASGGGWPAAPGRMDGLAADILTVWLRVEPETAVDRAARDGGTRPLLSGPDPLSRARSLLAAREPWYARAALHLDTDRASPDALVAAIVKKLEGRAATGAS